MDPVRARQLFIEAVAYNMRSIWPHLNKSTKRRWSNLVDALGLPEESGDPPVSQQTTDYHHLDTNTKRMQWARKVAGSEDA